MGLGAGLRLRNECLVKSKRRAFRDLQATLNHKFALCIGQSRIIVSDYSGKGYMDSLLWSKMTPCETTNGYAAPKPGGDIARSLGVSTLLA